MASKRHLRLDLHEVAVAVAGVLAGAPVGQPVDVLLIVAGVVVEALFLLQLLLLLRRLKNVLILHCHQEMKKRLLSMKVFAGKERFLTTLADAYNSYLALLSDETIEGLQKMLK
jgi:hypothetical protein